MSFDYIDTAIFAGDFTFSSDENDASLFDESKKKEFFYI